MTNTIKWTNAGDVNIAEYGRLATNDFDSDYIDVITCDMDYSTGMYRVAQCRVDIDDLIDPESWIDIYEVLDFEGVSEDEVELTKDDNFEGLTTWAMSAIDYHGVENFTDYYMPVQYLSYEQAKTYFSSLDLPEDTYFE